jgi:hypothetical protein
MRGEVRHAHTILMGSDSFKKPIDVNGRNVIRSSSEKEGFGISWLSTGSDCWIL